MSGFYVLVMMLFQGNKIRVPLAKHPSSILLPRGRQHCQWAGSSSGWTDDAPSHCSLFLKGRPGATCVAIFW